MTDINREALTEIIWQTIDNPALRHREAIRAADAVIAHLSTLPARQGSVRTKYREPWFLSNENGSGEWCITDGVETQPIADATTEEFGLALEGTIERALSTLPVEPKVEWEPAKWQNLTADTDLGDPTGDTIRLTWDDGTVLVGRLSVPSFGSGHHQVCRMHTVFGGDTYVYPHGSTLERKVVPNE